MNESHFKSLFKFRILVVLGTVVCGAVPLGVIVSSAVVLSTVV